MKESSNKLKLMLVNDEPIQLSMLEYHMKRAFNSSHVATFMGINGAEALREIKQNLQEILRYQKKQLKLEQRGECNVDQHIEDKQDQDSQDISDIAENEVPRHYNMIILDLNMPIMDGKEACRKII